MKKKIYCCAKLACFMLLLQASLSSLKAQVTIGSEIPPIKGALLDLKQYTPDAENKTATMGILLPRVELTDINNLFPMFGDDGMGGYKTAQGSFDKITEDATHTGLTVYNMIRNICLADPLYKGVYTWNGSSWIFMGIEPGESSSLYTVKDTRDGETYSASNFGEAGDWMLENMRYIDASFSVSIAGETTSFGSSNIRRYFYPQPFGTYNGVVYPGKETDPANISSWNKKQGLLYTYAAATMGAYYNQGIEQGQVSGDIPGPNEIESTLGKIQGICPEGWHIPSDREWNDLEREIYNNPNKYSLYTSADLPLDPANPSWNPKWEYDETEGKTWRGSSTDKGHGRAMMAECPVPGPQDAASGGSSKRDFEGGFSILPVGTANDGTAKYYGTATYFWTSSSAASSLNGWYRQFSTENVDVYRFAYRRYNLYSVRCKKDAES